MAGSHQDDTRKKTTPTYLDITEERKIITDPDMIKLMDSAVALGLITPSNSGEIKLNKASKAYIELVQSEETYLGKLDILHDDEIKGVLKQCKKDAPKISKDLENLIKQAVAIKDAEQNFLAKLKEPDPLAWKEALDSLQQKYINYISDQDVIVKIPPTVFNKLLEFPRSQGQRLDAVLMEPVQRGMRFQMPLEEALKRIPDSSPAKASVDKALEAARDFANSGNKGRALAEENQSRKVLKELSDTFNKKPSDKTLTAYLEALKSSPLSMKELQAEMLKFNFSKLTTKQTKLCENFIKIMQTDKDGLNKQLTRYEEAKQGNQRIIDDFKAKNKHPDSYKEEVAQLATAEKDIAKTKSAIAKNEAKTDSISFILKVNKQNKIDAKARDKAKPSLIANIREALVKDKAKAPKAKMPSSNVVGAAKPLPQVEAKPVQQARRLPPLPPLPGTPEDKQRARNYAINELHKAMTLQTMGISEVNKSNLEAIKKFVGQSLENNISPSIVENLRKSLPDNPVVQKAVDQVVKNFNAKLVELNKQAGIKETGRVTPMAPEFGHLHENKSQVSKPEQLSDEAKAKSKKRLT